MGQKESKAKQVKTKTFANKSKQQQQQSKLQEQRPSTSCNAKLVPIERLLPIDRHSKPINDNDNNNKYEDGNGNFVNLNFANSENGAIGRMHSKIDCKIDGANSSANDDFHDSNGLSLIQRELKSELRLMEAQMRASETSEPNATVKSAPASDSLRKAAGTRGVSGVVIEAGSGHISNVICNNENSRSVDFDLSKCQHLKSNYIQREIGNLKDLKMSGNNADSSPPTASTIFMDHESPLASPLAGRATTTERRTTTTTTTKRIVKSSDDFVPAATDIQQLRSESRTSSISSAATPLYNQAREQTSSTTSQHQHPSQQSHASTTSSSTTTTTKQQQTANNKQSNTTQGWSEGLQSPFIQDTEEGRVLKLRFDVTQYEANEIVVKTVDNRLTVQAKHEEKSENRTVYREYNREFHLPDGTDVEQIRSSLSKDGVLTVECPLPSPQLHGASRTIPIERV